MIYIRTDANSKIGMGHVMRCLSLADAFRSEGEEIVFILADHQVEKLVKERGYQTIILDTAYDDMESEIDNWPSELSCNFVIIDSYYVTYAYLEVLRKKTKIVYLDDTALFAYPVDIIINYNIYGPKIDYAELYSYHSPKTILGTQYVPMRSMFQNLPYKVQRKKCEEILFSTGGTDALHLTLRFLKERPEGYSYHILIGLLNPDRKIIKDYVQGQSNIIIHENVTDMKNLINNSDIVISAAGSTIYEICACGVPVITYVTADNQIRGAEAFAESGLAVNCGDMRARNHGIKDIIEAVQFLADKYEMRKQMGEKMQRMIDGKGAHRIVNEIRNYFNGIYG